MNSEFTGERVIPSLVDDDLWNEHFARYAFARRFAAGRRVLDGGCGTGYGSDELAAAAGSVTGIDIAREAVEYAAGMYPSSHFLQASCLDLPFASGSFDTVVLFEVIEHVAEWQQVLRETRRVLAPGGQLIVSTPNKSFYAKTRQQSGPNPFHEHEFEYSEFREALAGFFPQVAIFLQDHTQGILFRPAEFGGAAEGRVEWTDASPEHSSFFVAVCGDSAESALPAFVHIPRSSNVLHEKLVHIHRLEDEVRTKDGWIAEQQAAHQELLRQHSEQLSELEKSNQWAIQLGSQLTAAQERIAALQDEFAHQQRAAQEMAAGYEAQIDTLNATVQERTEWARETERRLTADLAACAANCEQQTRELAACVDLLHRTEATLEERTRWAVELNEEKSRLEATLSAVRASRWIRVGRMFGLGPELQGPELQGH